MFNTEVKGLWQVILLHLKFTGVTVEENYGEPVDYETACINAKIGTKIYSCSASIRRVSQ